MWACQAYMVRGGEGKVPGRRLASHLSLTHCAAASRPQCVWLKQSTRCRRARVMLQMPKNKSAHVGAGSPTALWPAGSRKKAQCGPAHSPAPGRLARCCKWSPNHVCLSLPLHMLGRRAVCRKLSLTSPTLAKPTMGFTCCVKFWLHAHMLLTCCRGAGRMPRMGPGMRLPPVSTRATPPSARM